MIKWIKIFAILFFNIVVLSWLIKVTFFDKDADFIGLLTIGTFLFLILFNVYAVILYFIFNRRWKNWVSVIVFFVLLVIPFIILWKITSK